MAVSITEVGVVEIERTRMRTIAVIAPTKEERITRVRKVRVIAKPARNTATSS